ncbi:hypothetical protein TCAP_05002 [Tolypocladium capitatum]|uniref:Uncharacterized protein n=1 Tax=Tolypocladium capitatum TaxID=45235 RepID=A0A2K3QC25_9HYPO|nr:hypothetical protein TCAP_05002 [Tolypocladium capitatum]
MGGVVVPWCVAVVCCRGVLRGGRFTAVRAAQCVRVGDSVEAARDLMLPSMQLAEECVRARDGWLQRPSRQRWASSDWPCLQPAEHRERAQEHGGSSAPSRDLVPAFLLLELLLPRHAGWQHHRGNGDGALCVGVADWHAACRTKRPSLQDRCGTSPCLLGLGASQLLSMACLSIFNLHGHTRPRRRDSRPRTQSFTVGAALPGAAPPSASATLSSRGRASIRKQRHLAVGSRAPVSRRRDAVGTQPEAATGPASGADMTRRRRLWRGQYRPGAWGFIRLFVRQPPPASDSPLLPNARPSSQPRSITTAQLYTIRLAERVATPSSSLSRPAGAARRPAP